MKFHELLRKLKGDMSEAKLAEAAGIPYPSVHSYCLGRRMPTFAAVVKLARALGTTCEAFAECEDLMEADGRGKPAEKPAPKRSSPKERKKG
jgi:plasmid maintenance system antidote protein VapI